MTHHLESRHHIYKYISLYICVYVFKCVCVYIFTRVARQQSEEGEKNGSEDDDEEKPGKRVMGPRKKFLWDDKLR